MGLVRLGLALRNAAAFNGKSVNGEHSVRGAADQPDNTGGNFAP